MGKEFLKFDDVEIENQKFHSSKREVIKNEVDIEKITISNKFSCVKRGSKCFISCQKWWKICLCVLLPKLREYVRNFNCAKTEYFLIKEEEVKNIIKSEQKLKYFKETR